MLLIVFNKEIKDGQKIRNLSERFIDELPGIFNEAIKSLANLMKQGKFTKSKKMLNELEEYKDDVNPMRAFVRDAVEANDKYFVPNTYLYSVYRYYVTDKGGQPLSSKRFFQALKDEMMLNGKYITSGRRRIASRMQGLSDRPHCTFGVKLTNNLEFDALNIEGASLQISAMNFFDKNGAKADEEANDE